MRPKNPKPQFKVRLDKLVYETFKMKCKASGQKPNEVIEQLISLYLEYPLIIRLLEGE